MGVAGSGESGGEWRSVGGRVSLVFLTCSCGWSLRRKGLAGCCVGAVFWGRGGSWAADSAPGLRGGGTLGQFGTRAIGRGWSGLPCGKTAGGRCEALYRYALPGAAARCVRPGSKARTPLPPSVGVAEKRGASQAEGIGYYPHSLPAPLKRKGGYSRCLPGCSC